MIDRKHMWFMLLGSVTSTLAILSMLPNYALAFMLTRYKNTNAALFTLRSCACADIISGSLFLVFIFPSWIQGDKTFGSIACTVGGILITWIGLVLHYSLVYLVFQRYSLTKRIWGWSLLKDYFRFFNISIWIFAGLLAALPFTKSNSAYNYNAHLCHCALDKQHRILVYDHLEYLMPGFLLFVAGICLTSLKKTQNGKERKRKVSTEYYQYQIDQYDSKRQTYTPQSSEPSDSTLETRSIESETKVSFTYIAFISSLLTLSSYGFRTYGNWIQPGNCTIQATSILLTFANGITRSVTIFVVSRALRVSYKEKLKQRVRTVIPESKARYDTSLGVSEFRRHSNCRRSSGFTSFSLSMLSSGSTHNRGDRMDSFWSDPRNTPVSSLESFTDAPKSNVSSPEIRWKNEVTRLGHDSKYQYHYKNYNRLKMSETERKKGTRISITSRTKMTSNTNRVNRTQDMDLHSREDYKPRGTKHRSNYKPSKDEYGILPSATSTDRNSNLREKQSNSLIIDPALYHGNKTFNKTTRCDNYNHRVVSRKNTDQCQLAVSIESPNLALSLKSPRQSKVPVSGQRHKTSKNSLERTKSSYSKWFQKEVNRITTIDVQRKRKNYKEKT